jgi:hypothetical protein
MTLSELIAVETSSNEHDDRVADVQICISLKPSTSSALPLHIIQSASITTRHGINPAISSRDVLQAGKKRRRSPKW